LLKICENLQQYSDAVGDKSLFCMHARWTQVKYCAASNDIALVSHAM